MTISANKSIGLAMEAPLAALLRLLGREAASLGFPAYVVGGFVRDRLATQLLPGTFSNIDGLDIDIVLEGTGSEGSGIQLAYTIQQRYGGHVVTHERFGTATWSIDDKAAASPATFVKWEVLLAALELDTSAGLPGHMDFVTARRETYPEPASLPEVQPSDMTADLLRRDLSINTLAISIHPDTWGKLLDKHNGISDLKNGVIRILHDESFIDDPTRIFRAVRYEQRFGFTIEPATLGLLQAALPLIAKLTPVRVLHEFDRIFDERAPAKVLGRLDELGILTEIHPHFSFSDAAKCRVESYLAGLGRIPAKPNTESTNADPSRLTQTEGKPESSLWALLLLELPYDELASLFDRIALPREAQKRVADLQLLQQQIEPLSIPALRPSQVAQRLDNIQPSTIELASTITQEALFLDYTNRYLTQWRHVKPELDGNELARLGVPRGPQYRVILAALRSKRLDGEIINRDGEVTYVLGFDVFGS